MKKLLQIIRFINNHPLASKHPSKALSRFITWQIVQLIYPHTKSVKFIGSTRLIMKKGMTGATGNYYVGLHEFYEMSFLLHLLREGDLFADVGANVGSYTVLASGYCGATTMAFEPVPKTFSWLNKNIKINKIENKVYAYNIGLGSKEGELSFSHKNDTVNHVVMNSQNEDVIKVPISSLDLFVQKHGTPALIKIDVEGFEKEVIDGLRNLIYDENLKAIIVELNGSGIRYGFDDNLVSNYLLSIGFQTYEYDPFKRDLKIVNALGKHNTLFIRDFEFVNNRIKTASKNRIFGETF
ncbi:MAG: FkbM family methyltransferase [Bacteroidetes bacterium]|nr:FkbM family methyltransferase [Bacteroidota bacterium]